MILEGENENEKLFTNDKFFLATTLIAFFGNMIFMGIRLFLMGNIDYIISRIPLVIMAICVLFLYYSYRKHSKNVMKGLMGAILMSLILAAINCFSFICSPIDVYFCSIYLAAIVLLFISHFIINSEHHSKPGFVKLNQVLCLISLLDLAAWEGMYLVLYDHSLLSIITSAIDVLATAALTATIVCVESRLDAYRLDREAAGWTEEKGYPDGYVHEYEKK